jgi:hypothetical protein
MNFLQNTNMSLKRKSSESLDRSTVATDFLDLFQELVLDMGGRWRLGCSFPCLEDYYPEEATEENARQPDLYLERPFHVEPSSYRPDPAGPIDQIFTIFTVKLRHRNIHQNEFEECLQKIKESNVEELICRSYDRVLHLTEGQWFYPCDGSFFQISGIHSIEWHDGIIHIKGRRLFEKDWWSWEPFDAFPDKQFDTWDKEGNLSQSQKWVFCRGLRVPYRFIHCVHPAQFSKYNRS